jgi:hypothetical protein
MEDAPIPTPETGTDELRPRWLRAHDALGLVLGAWGIVHVLLQASALGGSVQYAALAGAAFRASWRPVVDVVVLGTVVLYVGLGLARLRWRNAEIDAKRSRAQTASLVHRVATIPALVFVVVHIAELRGLPPTLGTSASDPIVTMIAHVSSTWAGIPWVALLYITALAAVFVHLGSAFVRALPSSKRLAVIAISAALFAISALSVLSLATGTVLLPTGTASSSLRAVPCGSAPPPSPLPPQRTPFR